MSQATRVVRAGEIRVLKPCRQKRRSPVSLTYRMAHANRKERWETTSSAPCGGTFPIGEGWGDDLFRRCAPPSPEGEGWRAAQRRPYKVGSIEMVLLSLFPHRTGGLHRETLGTSGCTQRVQERSLLAPSAARLSLQAQPAGQDAGETRACRQAVARGVNVLRTMPPVCREQRGMCVFAGGLTKEVASQAFPYGEGGFGEKCLHFSSKTEEVVSQFFRCYA